MDDTINKKMKSVENVSLDKDNNIDIDPWTIVKSMLSQYDNKELIRHHIDSYNNFMEKKIPDIVKQNNPLIIYHDYVAETNTYNNEIKINFNDVYYTKPIIHENNGSTNLMTPNEARLRNFTYSLPIYIDMDVEIVKNPLDKDNRTVLSKKKLKKINIGKIPIMLGSKYCVLNKLNNSDECKYDLGGYFIINGNEKVIVCQEMIAHNLVFVFKSGKSSSKYSHIVDVKSTAEDGFYTPKNVSLKLTSRDVGSGKVIRAMIPHVRHEIPLFILFRALGLESDKEIIKYIVYDLNNTDNNQIINWLKPSIEEGSTLRTQQECLEYLLKYSSILGQPKDIKLTHERRVVLFKEMLERDVLPHVGMDLRRKALFFGYMVNKLGKCYFKQINYDDRDNYCNKRIETSGTLMAALFRQYFTKLIKDMRNSIMKELNSGPWKTNKNIEDVINSTNLYKIIKSTTLESGLKYGLATGNWGMKSTTNKVGIAQVLSRLTFYSTLSHLRRVNTPTEKTGKLIPPRKLHNTQWGIICPTETPEGGSVGLVKNLAISCHITTGSDSKCVKDVLNNEGLIKLEDIMVEELYDRTKIFVNGNWLGIHDNSIDLLKKLRNYKRLGKLNIFSSISFNYDLNEINIFTDAGRCSRPLHIVDNNKLRITTEHINNLKTKKISWNNLIVQSLNYCSINDKYDNSLQEGVLEYVDSQESCQTMIAMNHKDLRDNKYEYCEIHPSLILGILASSIPFSNHNQSPRNTYQSAMGKQAMGIYATNYRNRMDTMAHVLYYPNKPLVNTRLGLNLPSDNIPNGMNVIVAICSYSGYNQEDSIIVNKSSVDRGLFRSTFYRTYKDDEKRIQSSGQEEKFIKPHKKFTKGLKPGSYEKLDENGFVEENIFVDQGDVIIGKVIPVKNESVNGNQLYKDNSTVLRANESGFVDKKYVNRNGDGHRFCKVRVRSERIPKIGDKFSSRHGQKGTVGMLYNEEDMPFTKDGIRPDIIINPHAIPSRMTIAQLIECIMGKVCALKGAHGDGTPFMNTSVEDIANILESELNFNKHGNEVMYDGFTGRQLKTSIFIGPTFYQRLKHMVEDKIHSRATGPMVLMTRQPAEGRARDGGLRFGEMERDCMIAHGSLQFLKERTLDASDNYRLFVCKKCGLTASVNPDKNIYCCKSCSNYTEFSEVRMPYACKLLLQELESMSIAPRLLTE